MTHEEKLRSICQSRCAEYGDPPCYELDNREQVPVEFCTACRAEAGEEIVEPLDPNAVVRPLL